MGALESQRKDPLYPPRLLLCSADGQAQKRLLPYAKACMTLRDWMADHPQKIPDECVLTFEHVLIANTAQMGGPQLLRDDGLGSSEHLIEPWRIEWTYMVLAGKEGDAEKMVANCKRLSESTTLAEHPTLVTVKEYFQTIGLKMPKKELFDAEENAFHWSNEPLFRFHINLESMKIVRRTEVYPWSALEQLMFYVLLGYKADDRPMM